MKIRSKPGLLRALDRAVDAILRIRATLSLGFGCVGKIIRRISFRGSLLEAELDGVDITRSCGVCLGWLIHTCSPTVAMEFPC